MAIAPDKKTIITRRDGTKETIVTSGRTGKKTVNGKEYNPRESFARSAVRSVGKSGFRVTGEIPLGFEDKPEPIKEEQFEIERAPESMKPKIAEQQGYQYSNTMGYYRTPGTDKNIRIARERLENARKTVFDADYKTKFQIGNKTIGRGEALQNIDQGLDDLKHSTLVNNNYTEKQQQQHNLNKVANNITAHPLDSLFGERNLPIPQSQSFFDKNNNIPNAVKYDTKSTNIDNNRKQTDINVIQKHQEELSWLGKSSLKASAWWQDNVTNKISEDIDRRLEKNKTTGPFPKVIDEWAKKTPKYAIEFVTSLPGGVLGVPAFIEGMIRHPKDSARLGKIAGKGVVETAKTDPVGLIAGFTAGGLLGGGMSKMAGSGIKTATTPKIINTKFKGSESSIGNLKEVISRVKGNVEVTSKSLFGKPKTTKYNADIINQIDILNSGASFSGSSNIRLITRGVKPKLHATKTDFSGTVKTTAKNTKNTASGNVKTRETTSNMHVAEYQKHSMKNLKFDKHFKATEDNFHKSLDMGTITKGKTSIRTNVDEGNFFNINKAGNLPATTGKYKGVSRVIKTPQNNILLSSRRAINARTQNLLPKNLNVQLPRIIRLGKIPQKQPTNPTNFNFMKTAPKNRNTVTVTQPKTNVKTPQGSLRLEVNVPKPANTQVAVNTATSYSTRHVMELAGRRSLVGHPAINTGNMGRIGGIALATMSVPMPQEVIPQHRGRIAPANPIQATIPTMRTAQIRVPNIPVRMPIQQPQLPTQTQRGRQRQTPIFVPNIPINPYNPRIRTTPTMPPLIVSPPKVPRIGGFWDNRSMHLGVSTNGLTTVLKTVNHNMKSIDDIL